jgi:8-amino-7-oxononanoate synthase
LVDKCLQENWLDEALAGLRQQGLYREMVTSASAAGVRVSIAGQQRLNFCSNNYLGLANHPAVIRAVQHGVETWGFGTGASRLICGNMTPHEQVQERVARFLRKESALVFPTGFMANYALLSSLPEKGDLILLDKLVHASIIDGARTSAAAVRTFGHLRYDKLVRLLERGGYRRAFIVTDSLFSMDGDKARLAELVEIKKQFDAVLIVDEAHAFGCLGPGGRGCAAEQGVLDEVDVTVATFSKALGGSGGLVAGAAALIDVLINKARAFIYTTAIPPVNCLAAMAALDIIEAEPQRQQRLTQNTEMLRNQLEEMGCNIGDSQSYILPIILGGAEEAVRVSERLWKAGFVVPAIRPPTVAPGSSRLRISLMSEHTQEEINALCQAIITT